MDVARLVYMANQIGRAFHAEGEAAAIAATADHLRKFWDPRMRRQIADHLAAGGEGLDPAARAAVAQL
jgi:formate dehydrogenase subunit delta